MKKMSKQLSFIINGPNDDCMLALLFAGMIAAISIILFITDLTDKKFGKISFLVSVISIAIVVACCNYNSAQDKKGTLMINNLAKEYPRMTVAKIDKNDYVFYFKDEVKHNSDNIIKNQVEYEVRDNNEQRATVQKIKPQAILAQELNENQDTKKCIMKFIEGAENDE